MDLLLFPVIGFVVSIIIGLSGMGGGALMTPALMFAGIPIQVAISTDLLYASITKMFALGSRYKDIVVNQNILLVMIIGSLAGALITSIFIKEFLINIKDLNSILSVFLACTLLLTAIALVIINSKFKVNTGDNLILITKKKLLLTFFTAFTIGTVVPLTSVGSGALGIVTLLLIYPNLPINQSVNIDISYAIPLTMVSWISLWIATKNYGDMSLLLKLLAGSIPGAFLSEIILKKMSGMFIRVLVSILLLITSLKIFAKVLLT